MRYRSLLLAIFLISFSCNDSQKEDSSQNNQQENAEKITKDPSDRDKAETQQEYSNSTYSFSFSYPEELSVLESKLAGDVPVINVFDPDAEKQPPYAIHEAAGIPYIAVLPEGFGVDGPSGERISLEKYLRGPSFGGEIDPTESQVYLLENGQAWAMNLKPAENLQNWKEFGSIFMHFKVNNFESNCIDGKTGEEKPLKECDNMGGPDKIIFKGKVDEESKQQLMDVLQSMKFGDSASNDKNAADLVQIEQPLPNIEISSPLKIKGKAKGYWYFEGQAPVKLVDKDGKILAESSVKAQGNWMTEDFVPFSGELKFSNAPDDERGYLVFMRSNASGKPENDMEYRLPVLFPPK